MRVVRTIPALPSRATQTSPSLSLRALFAMVLAVAVCACRHAAPKPPAAPPPVLAAGALVPSPRLIVGRIVAIDLAQGFAFVELAADAPSAATVNGTELIARTLDLRETGQLRSSRYVRGRTLGTKILAGQPTPGDEVVWLAP